MSKESDKGAGYKHTLNLPQTDFPMRANLVTREPERLEKWNADGLYGKILEKRKNANAPTYILHDGPPFANGDVHMGTALNKVLKDLVVKSRSMAGYYAPYLPGWDCHGLPIEFKVVKASRGLSPVEVRKQSEEYARKYIDIQRNSFRRLGVLGDWENPYLTLDPGYEAEIIRTFAVLVEKGLVYQSKKPVLWSYGAHTALAEAEVEYKDKQSPAIFVKFPVTQGKFAGETSLVIWTTTPWTLPANLAVALHPQFTYVRGNFSHEDGRKENLIIVKSLLESFAQSTGFKLDVAGAVEIRGDALEAGAAAHPFLDRESKIIVGQFVTDDTGTGAVHVAPGTAWTTTSQASRTASVSSRPSTISGISRTRSASPSWRASTSSRPTTALSKSSARKASCSARKSSSIPTRTAGAPRRRSSSAPCRETCSSCRFNLSST